MSSSYLNNSVAQAEIIEQKRRKERTRETFEKYTKEELEEVLQNKFEYEEFAVEIAEKLLHLKRFDR